MKVAALQTLIAWEDPEHNFATLEPWVRLAAEAGARLVCLPEMFACGFSMETRRTAERPAGRSVRFLKSLASRYHLWICGSVPIRGKGDTKPANTLVLAEPSGALHRYEKMRPFRYAGEHECFRSGAATLTVPVGELRCTFFICYDLRFADLFWERAPETDAYIVVANWPSKRRAHWQTLLRARAIENQAYVVGVNRVGEGGGLSYAGDSAIIDPWGEVLASAAGQEAMLIAELDPAGVAATRAGFPVLADRATGT